MDYILLTVFFENPFWVAVFERQVGNHYQAARHVFGAEPSDPEVYHFVLRAFNSLVFSQPGRQERSSATSWINPKRRQREVRREMERPRTSTRAQEALQREREADKQERQLLSREARDEAQRRKYELRQLKRKQKHLGR